MGIKKLSVILLVNHVAGSDDDVFLVHTLDDVDVLQICGNVVVVYGAGRTVL